MGLLPTTIVNIHVPQHVHYVCYILCYCLTVAISPIRLEERGDGVSSRDCLAFGGGALAGAVSGRVSRVAYVVGQLHWYLVGSPLVLSMSEKMESAKRRCMLCPLARAVCADQYAMVRRPVAALRADGEINRAQGGIAGGEPFAVGHVTFPGTSTRDDGINRSTSAKKSMGS